MDTISKNISKRLLAQANEANYRGLTKIASIINKQANSKLREDFEPYSYSEMEDDVDSLFWSASTRIQDYFDKTADALEVQEIISQAKDDFIESIRKKIGGDVIGPKEPTVPGEEYSVEVD